MGPGNAAAVRVWTVETGRFAFRSVQQHQPWTHGGAKLDRYASTSGFRQVCLDPSVIISGFTFWVSHLWSHSDVLLLIVKYWYCYVTFNFRCVGHLKDQNESIHAPYHVMIISVNGVSTIVGFVSWVIRGCHLSNTVIHEVLAAFIAKNASETLPIPSWKWASMEHQGFWVFHLQ